MSHSYPLKNLPTPLQLLIRPMLLLSLGLHGLLIFLPMPSSQEAVPPKAEEEKLVNLTQLPSSDQKPAPKSPSSPEASVQASPPVRRAVTPIPRRPSNIPPVSQPSRSPTQDTPPQGDAGQTSPSSSAEDSGSTTDDPFLADFPRYPGTQPGSFGLPGALDSSSFKTGDAVARVEGFFKQELAVKKYTIQPVEQPGRTVYQVSRAGTTQYLSLIPNPEGSGTSIVLSQEQLPDDLTSEGFVSPEEQRFYADLPVPNVEVSTDEWQQVSEPEKLLANPNSFFASLGGQDSEGFYTEPEFRPEIDRAVVGVGQQPQTLESSLRSNLKSSEYTVKPLGSYGGGSLFQVTREGVTGYINLVPTKNTAATKGTVVVIWKRSPKDN